MREAHATGGSLRYRRVMREDQPAIASFHVNDVAGCELASENFFSQRIFQLLLDRTFERACTVDRIETDVGEQVQGLVG